MTATLCTALLIIQTTMAVKEGDVTPLTTSEDVEWDERSALLPESKVYKSAPLIDFKGRNRLLVVTAFQDIGRGSWGKHGTSAGRSNGQYIRWFKNLVSLSGYDVQVYMSEEMRELAEQSLASVKIKAKVYFSTITKSSPPRFSTRYLSVEDKIIQSHKYKYWVGKKGLHSPEHSVARYNLANHDKIIFVQDAVHRWGTAGHARSYSHFAWVDFGVIRSPNSTFAPRDIDECMLPRSRVLYQAKTDFYKERYIPERYMLHTNLVYVFGSMWIVPTGPIIDKYVALYDELLQEWHRKGMVDDDQSVVYQLAWQNPDIFAFSVDRTFFTLFDSWPRVKSNCMHCDSVCDVHDGLLESATVCATGALCTAAVFGLWKLLARRHLPPAAPCEGL
jgi:hypothetical protein